MLVFLNILVELPDQFRSRGEDRSRTETGPMHFAKKGTRQNFGYLVGITISKPVGFGRPRRRFLQKRQLGKA